MNNKHHKLIINYKKVYNKYKNIKSDLFILIYMYNKLQERYNKLSISNTDSEKISNIYSEKISDICFKLVLYYKSKYEVGFEKLDIFQKILLKQNFFEIFLTKNINIDNINNFEEIESKYISKLETQIKELSLNKESKVLKNTPDITEYKYDYIKLLQIPNKSDLENLIKNEFLYIALEEFYITENTQKSLQSENIYVNTYYTIIETTKLINIEMYISNIKKENKYSKFSEIYYNYLESNLKNNNKFLYNYICNLESVDYNLIMSKIDFKILMKINFLIQLFKS